MRICHVEEELATEEQAVEVWEPVLGQGEEVAPSPRPCPGRAGG